MLGVVSVGTYLPPERQNNAPLATSFGFNESFLKSKLGFLATARKPLEMETSDLCVAAFRDLQARHTVNPATIDAIVVVTQNPDGHGLPHTSAVVHQKLGLPLSCFAFDVSLGCSGFVAALAIVKGFLESTGRRRAILFTADPYSKVLDIADRNTALIFGDGATATLIDDSETWHIGGFDVGTEGTRSDAIAVGADGKLRMNGRAVFDFCALNVPASVERTLRAHALSKSDIDAYLMHPGSRYIVDAIAKRLDIPSPPFVAGQYGNTVSSSIPMMLADLSPSKTPTVLICGFGVGLGWATTILKGA
jgi:3-oxoacyl-[acyl-carrier-protein] synthase-3